jgi:2-C-methyl-D-erythritol 4-phosphate cytidylyltransferase
VSKDIIQSSYASAFMYGSGIPCVKLKDSIRKVVEEQSFAYDRNQFVSVQTPQVFEAKGIKQAYEILNQQDVSDDATVWELSGRAIHLTVGDYANIKITTPEDLLFAKLLMGQTKA